MEVAFYKSGVTGDGNGQQSGAYIFRPSTDSPHKIPLSLSNPEWRQGGLVTEKWYKASEGNTDMASFVVRTFGPNPDYAEVEWLVGPIPIDDATKQGKEVSDVRITSTSLR